MNSSLAPIAEADERSPRRTIYYACPYWLWRSDDLSHAVRLMSNLDSNLLGVSLVYPERDVCVGQKWSAKAERIQQSHLVIARPDLKPSPVLDKRDCDVFLEVGFAIAKGVPVAWLRHPSDEQMPFMVATEEVVTTGNVVDAVSMLSMQALRATKRTVHAVQDGAATIFLSAPYNDKSENRFSVAIRPSAEKAGLNAFFARGALGPGNACEQVFAKIRNCRCLVADVSQRSQNVAIEVGYALGLGIDVALIRDSASSPIDGNLGGFACVEFDTLQRSDGTNGMGLQQFDP